MVTVCSCPLCEEGQVAFRTCLSTSLVVLVCDTCGYLWMHPARVDRTQALDPLHPETLRRFPDCNLRPSRWATPEEIEGQGWGAYLLTPGNFHPS